MRNDYFHAGDGNGKTKSLSCVKMRWEWGALGWSNGSCVNFIPPNPYCSNLHRVLVGKTLWGWGTPSSSVIGGQVFLNASLCDSDV
mmetsp:Transcript_28438/g.32703  ORF Transcript_28438/g.32703 Transcript_28438/m.32703 type:complete len:86 (+) Transcript_28438:371-628(+)